MTDAVTATGTSLYANPVTRAPKQAMDGEMFLSLLVTQLRNQDPSSPLDTNGMIEQTASLASMEQLTSLATVTQDSYALQQRIAASSIIGTQVSYQAEDGSTVSGLASSVSFAGTTPTVTVGDKSVELSKLTAIARPTAS